MHAPQAAQTSEPSNIAYLVDIGPAVHQRAGLSRYAERLAFNLAEKSAGESLALFYNRHSGHTLPASLRGTPTHSLAAGQYLWRLSVLGSQLARVPYAPLTSLLRAMQKRGPQGTPVVYHATEHLLPRLSFPTVLTVHDLIFDRFPEYHTRANRLFLKLGMPLFIRNATRIIAVSQNTKCDLVARYSVKEDRIRVVYEGIDDDFAPATADEIHRVKARYADGCPYLLMVGSIEPRKNHVAAIRALAALSEAGYTHRLLIAGARGWMVDPILRYARRSAVSHRVSFLDFVPQEELPALYAAADVYLLPSHYEGFGFTALEAMACGTPVICSNVGSLPEVTGGAAILVAPNDLAGITQSIRNVLDQPRLAETMVGLGLANASRFRWPSCASETVSVYREASRVFRN